MPSQMYNMYQQTQPNPIFNMFGGYQNFMQQYNNLACTMQRSCNNANPEMLVKQMLANGQMSQEQFDTAKQMADAAWPYLQNKS